MERIKGEKKKRTSSIDFRPARFASKRVLRVFGVLDLVLLVESVPASSERAVSRGAGRGREGEDVREAGKTFGDGDVGPAVFVPAADCEEEESAPW